MTNPYYSADLAYERDIERADAKVDYQERYVPMKIAEWLDEYNQTGNVLDLCDTPELFENEIRELETTVIEYITEEAEKRIEEDFETGAWS